MRPRTQLESCNAIEKSVDELLELYDYAEELYPYQNVHRTNTLIENEKRKANIKFHTEENLDYVIRQGSVLPFLFVYMMSRGGANGLLDFGQITKRPVRALGWFMLGHSVLMVQRILFLHSIKGTDQATHNLHIRVDQNEQTHSVLRAMKHHLATRNFTASEYIPE
mmetsp:Transcript_3760/g.6418  ORF Transcript_3760/g.6418 Transcript_3760/m.6418 type:complete len:166 (-) Transcript_3760:143-640(-)